MSPADIRYYSVVVEAGTHGDHLPPEVLAEQAPFVARGAAGTSALDFATGLLDFDAPRAQAELAEAVLALDPSGETEAAQQLGLGLGTAARGGWDSTLVALDRWQGHARTRLSAAVPDAPLLAYGFAVTGALLGETGAGVARAHRAAAAGIAETAPGRAELAWLDGVLAYVDGDAEGLGVAREALGRIAGAEAPFAGLLTRSLEAFERALEGETGAAGHALAELELAGAERQLHHRSAVRHPFLNTVHRLAAVPWLVEAGDTALAARLLTWTEAVYWSAQRFLDPVNRTFHTYALLERARIADRQGRRAEALELYRRFIDRYDLGRGDLQEEAIAALRRLGEEPPP